MCSRSARGSKVFDGSTTFDLNRCAGADTSSSVPITASVFVDIFNIFVFFLELF